MPDYRQPPRRLDRFTVGVADERWGEAVKVYIVLRDGLTATEQEMIDYLAPARVRVRFADTDAMGVTHHANYLAFFEMGRVEAMRQIGVEYASVVSRGVHLVVVEASVRYQLPTFFDDLLLVFTHVTNLGHARFTFVYKVQRESDGALVASGQTDHACVDAHTLRPVRLPVWLRADLLRLCPRT